MMQVTWTTLLNIASYIPVVYVVLEHFSYNDAFCGTENCSPFFFNPVLGT